MQNNVAFEINVDDNKICLPCSYHNQMYRQNFKDENIDHFLWVSMVEYLTISLTALLPPLYPTALGLIGPSKTDDIWRKKPVLMMSAMSDQS